MRVLVADDDEAALMALELLLQRERMTVSCVRSPREVSAAVKSGSFDAVLLDLNYQRDTTSGSEGFSLLEELRQTSPQLPVVVMTGWASIEGAVRAMRQGASDYVPKPWDNVRLVALLRSLVPSPAVREPAASALAANGFESPAMKQVLATIDRVAFSDASILVTGEHGTGKEIVARLVHERSGRRGGFIAVNAGALPDGTFESELFGHVRGAFTDAKTSRVGAFGRARDGTLFLDELANMPLAQQAKLLRVLQERAFQPLGATEPEPSTARIVSATNANVEALVSEQRFRADLLYRVNVIRIHVPPLRERREEIPSLARHFVRRDAERYGLSVPALDDEVVDLLCAYEWPGNVRELEHAMQRAVLMSSSRGAIQCADVGLPASPGAAAPPIPTAPATAPAAPPETEPLTLRESERAAVLRTLERFPNDRAAAAKSLGLSRSAFYRRLAQLGIRPPR
ncbi:MAG TPA: sigma-54 dependent transcriptional regulator [Kofleriaceae bacterium]|nr:sigma-54 dependent transcriptional regulator [Kofleriaceae bacterium]